MIHNFKIRPYHNPEGVDESKVPGGWRFRYADELGLPPERCRLFGFDGKFSRCECAGGQIEFFTYIVPVTP